MFINRVEHHPVAKLQWKECYGRKVTLFLSRSSSDDDDDLNTIEFVIEYIYSPNSFMIVSLN
jgi:hypothetical protein